jgi:hypothetical protein
MCSTAVVFGVLHVFCYLEERQRIIVFKKDAEENMWRCEGFKYTDSS